jgi:hypothetical protein
MAISTKDPKKKQMLLKAVVYKKNTPQVKRIVGYTASESLV